MADSVWVGRGSRCSSAANLLSLFASHVSRTVRQQEQQQQQQSSLLPPRSGDTGGYGTTSSGTNDRCSCPVGKGTSPERAVGSG